jgi:hypothetical protein
VARFENPGVDLGRAAVIAEVLPECGYPDCAAEVVTSAFVALLVVLLAMKLFAVIRVPEEDARRSWPRRRPPSRLAPRSWEEG